MFGSVRDYDSWSTIHKVWCPEKPSYESRIAIIFSVSIRQNLSIYAIKRICHREPQHSTALHISLHMHLLIVQHTKGIPKESPILPLSPLRLLRLPIVHNCHVKIHNHNGLFLRPRDDHVTSICIVVGDTAIMQRLQRPFRARMHTPEPRDRLVAVLRVLCIVDLCDQTGDGNPWVNILCEQRTVE